MPSPSARAATSDRLIGRVSRVCVNGTDVCDAVDVPAAAGRSRREPLAHRPGLVGVLLGGRDAPGLPLGGVRRSLRVLVDGSQAASTCPISFAPGSPASYPQLTLDPAGPYTDGQQVTVTVQGWPGSIGQRPDLAIGNLVVGQCARPMSPNPAVCPGETSRLQPEPDGRYTATLALHRTLSQDVVRGEPVDCTQPGNCQVALALTPRGSNAIPLQFLVVILGVDVVVT